MWIVNDRTGDRIFLAKYYPGTWGVWYDDFSEPMEKLQEAFNKDEDRGNLFGPTDWKIEYETEDDPMVKGKRNVLESITRVILQKD